MALLSVGCSFVSDKRVPMREGSVRVYNVMYWTYRVDIKKVCGERLD